MLFGFLTYVKKANARLWLSEAADVSLRRPIKWPASVSGVTVWMYLQHSFDL